MTSTDSTFDLESLLDDAQDLIEESFIARALLQPETNPWEHCCTQHPTEEPFNDIRDSLFYDPPANGLSATETTVKSEPVEDFDLLSTVPEPQYEDELVEYLNFTDEDLTIASPTTTVLLSSSPIDNSDVPLLHPDQLEEHAGYSYVNEQLEYPDTSTSPTTTVSSGSSPTDSDAAPLLELAQYFYFNDHLDDTVTTPFQVTDDSTSISVADTNPTHTASSLLHSLTSFFALTAPPPATVVSSSSPLSTILSSISSESPSSNAPTTNTEDLPCSTVNPDAGEAWEAVHYTFVDPHQKPRKRRAKGVKNSTPIACTFCRRRKIRCGGPKEGGDCKSCIRLNHKGDCVFPAVSYRGQRLGGSNSKRKSTSASKRTAKRTSHSFKTP